jgi:hypothetical protein
VVEADESLNVVERRPGGRGHEADEMVSRRCSSRAPCGGTSEKQSSSRFGLPTLCVGECFRTVGTEGCATETESGAFLAGDVWN